LQLLRGASSLAVKSQQVRERPFGLSAEGVASNAAPAASNALEDEDDDEHEALGEQLQPRIMCG
jgi:hypothetical protein